MKNTITRNAYAKINLGLDVTGVREDGYHLLRMIMQQIDLHDTLTFTVSPPSGPGRGNIILLDESGLSPAGEDNLICRAVRMMMESFDLRADIEIRLVKRIPVAAGLAGGSADAAAVIAVLCELWELDPDYELAASLGADVPFCLAVQHGLSAALATGTGTQLSPRQGAAYAVLLATPSIAVPTTAVYRELREEDCAPRFGEDRFGNHLQAPALRLFPQIRETLDWAGSLGADHVQLSGSGPTVLALFAAGRAIPEEIPAPPAGVSLFRTECL